MPGVSSRRPDVELRVPADGAYVSVLRTATAGVAARLDFTLDDIEDLRMAVGEASALVLEGARPDADLTARFWLGTGELAVVVAADADEPTAPDPEGFAWMVLTTLATDARVATTDGRLEITLVAAATPLEPLPGAQPGPAS
ncbi:MAG TPA: anti-sigma factor [Nocardioides sp.]|uniref:ATP-binding protein n=1 Tax=Nocardioides sp. TaxID=35761 RepID=UPI002ED8B361